MRLSERRTAVGKLTAPVLSFVVALVSAGAFTVPTASAAGGQTCSGQENPVVATANPFYDVENTSSAGGTACLTVSSTAEAFHVDSTNWNPSAPGADSSDPFIGFKAIYTGCKNGSCLEPGYPAVASSIVSEPTSWTFSSNFSSISGQFDAIYDSFFNTTPTQQYLPTGAELMVWMNYTSGESALGGSQLPDTTIGGQTYHVWSAVKTAGARTWNRIAFQRTSTNKTTSVSNLDMANFVQAAIADGAIQPGWYQQDLEAGFEIWSGGVGLTSSAFSAPAPTLSVASGSSGTSGTTGSTGATGSTGSTGSGSGSTGSTVAPGAPVPVKGHWYGKHQRRQDRQRQAAREPRHAGLFDQAVEGQMQRVPPYRRSVAVRVRFRLRAGQGQQGCRHGLPRQAEQRQGEDDLVAGEVLSSTAWKVHLGTLTKGHWRFTAVATDKAGHKVTSNAVIENINVGLAADARIPRRAT